MQKLLNLMKGKGIAGSSETHYWVVNKKRCALCEYNVLITTLCVAVHCKGCAYLFGKRVVYVRLFIFVWACTST